MDPEVHQNEVRELFKDVKLKKVLQPEPNWINYHLKRDLCRLEIGHCFSLGLIGIKRSGEGLTLKFDLSLAMLNFQH